MTWSQMNCHYESLQYSDEVISEYSSDCYESIQVEKWLHGHRVISEDKVAQELPIALVYNGLSHVVMMATPCHLEELALGFSLSEGIIDTFEQLYGVDIEVKEEGIELNIEISTERFVQLKHWRRNQTGRTGCGLCGVESLKQAIRAVPKVPQVESFQAQDLQKALTYLNQQQLLKHQTGASHCAAWYDIKRGQLILFEDIGRHNALDKLIGSLYQQQQSLQDGLALVSSRASYEMVTKACQVGISRLAAVSAPTSLAVNLARKSGLRLAGFVRPGRLNIYN